MAQDVRFSPAQRDALIDMAARIQAEHSRAEREASVGMDELAQAAREAGVDPRYLGEAAARLERAEPTDARKPLTAMAWLAAFDALFFGMTTRSWFFPVEGAFRLALLVLSAGAFAFAFTRHRALRGMAPLVPVAVWAALGILGAFAYRMRGHSNWSQVLTVAATYALVQAVVTGIVALLAWSQDRRR